MVKTLNLFFFLFILSISSCSLEVEKKIKRESFPGYISLNCMVFHSQLELLDLDLIETYQAMKISHYPFKVFVCKEKDGMFLKSEDVCFCLKELL